MNTENSKNFQINCKLYKCPDENCNYPLVYICSMKQFPVLREMHFCNALANYKISGFRDVVYYPNDSPRFDRRIWCESNSRNTPSQYIHMSSLIFRIQDNYFAYEPMNSSNKSYKPELLIQPTNLTIYNNWKLIPNTNRTFNVNIEGFLDDYKTDFFKDMFNALMEIHRIYAVR